MTKDRDKIIQGLVQHDNRWISIDEMAKLEDERRKKIQDGLVRFQGEWITIEEKLARVVPSSPPGGEPMQIHVNKTVKHQVYNVHHHHDNRSFHKTTHEHKHVHLDQRTLDEYIEGRKNMESSREDQALESGKRRPELNGRKQPPQIGNNQR
jgi:hypothetical protein